ncbi:MAG TPA: protein-disulfide reductase DsbD domain-containing protein [Acidobacteriaceae bacterium]|nr:protein-disulfide reductase DsbD domain-containing protein [Acidobacteriaceae bacterium]
MRGRSLKTWASFFPCAALCASFGFAPIAMAQSTWQPGHADIGFGRPADKQWLHLVSSPDVTVKAGEKNGRQKIALRFAIQSGLHINSHTPRSRFLIPTTLTLDGTTGVEISKIEYPQSADYHFEFSPNEAVSVYTGEFPVTVQLVASPGRHILHGRLRYQACDDRTCNPPKFLPLTLEVTAK